MVTCLLMPSSLGSASGIFCSVLDGRRETLALLHLLPLCLLDFLFLLPLLCSLSSLSPPFCLVSWNAGSVVSWLLMVLWEVLGSGSVLVPAASLYVQGVAVSSIVLAGLFCSGAVDSGWLRVTSTSGGWLLWVLGLWLLGCSPLGSYWLRLRCLVWVFAFLWAV